MRNREYINRWYLSLNVSNLPGAGAAGGLGTGVVAFSGGELKSGFKLISNAIGVTRMLDKNKFMIYSTIGGEKVARNDWNCR